MTSKRNLRHILILAAAIAAMFVFPGGAATAATLTWDANALGDGQPDGGGAWLDANQWWDGANNPTWTSGDDAIFGNAGAGGTVTLASPTAVNSLTFNGFTGTYTLGTAGQAITLTAGLTMNAGAGDVAIVSPITLGGAQSWTNNSTSTLTVGTGAVDNGGNLLTVGGSGNTAITGVIGNGAGGITKNDGGTLTLSAANTFTGAATLNGGTLKANGNANALGTGAATLVLSGGTLDFNHSALLAFNRNTTVGGTTTIISEKNVAGAGVTYTLGTLAIGASTLNIGGGNVTSGTAGVTFGAVTSSSSSTFTVDNPIDGGTTLLTLASIVPTAGSTLTFNGTGNTTVTGVLGATNAAVSKSGAGVLTLSGTNTYAGGTTISNGTVQFTKPVSMPASGAVAVNTGTTLAVNVGGTGEWGTGTSGNGTIGGLLAGLGGQSGGTVNYSGNVTLGLQVTGTQTYSGIIGNVGSSLSLSKTGSGGLTLSGANTYSGGTVISAGSVTVTADNNFGAATGSITFNGSPTVNFFGGTIGSGRTIILNEGANPTFDNLGGVTIAGPVTGSGGFTGYKAAQGNPTLTLSSTANTFTGPMNLRDKGASGTGSYTFYSLADSLSPGAGNIKFSYGGTGADFIWGTGAITSLILNNRQLDLAGSKGPVIKNNNGTATRIISINTDLLVSGAGAKVLTLAGSNTGNNAFAGKIIDGTGAVISLTKADGGVWILSGANTYTGATTVSAGTLSVSSLADAGEASNIGAYPTAGAAGLVLGGGTLKYTGGTKSTNRGLTLSATTTVNVSTNGAALTLGNSSLGAFQLNVTGGTGSSLGLGAVTLTGAATLNPTSANLTVASVTGTNQNLTLSGSSAACTVGAITTGTGTLTKNSTGTWTLSGANTYTGATTVSAGTLRSGADNVLPDASAVTVSGPAGTTTLDLAGNSDTIASLTLGGSAATSVAAVTTGAGTLTLGGDVTYVSTSNPLGATISGKLDLGAASRTFTVNDSTSAASDLTVSAVISGTDTGLTKAGAGTMVISAANTYGGPTAVNAGTLTLDYGSSSQDNSKLADGNALVLGGGTVNLSGGSHTEDVLSTTLTAGTASRVTRASGSAVLQMNTITRNAGAGIDFGASNIATTDNTNTNGILGTWATVGGTDWATNSTNDANGLITAYTAYTDVTRLDGGPQVIADGPATNVRIVQGTGSPAYITLGAATTTINTLNQNASGGAGTATIDPNGQTLSTSAILVGTGAGALIVGSGTNNGTLTAAAAGGDLALTNNTANALTVNSVIADNSTSTLTKMGAGTATLAAANTYAGGTTLAAGTLQLGNAGALGTGTLTFLGGNLDSSVLNLVNANDNVQAWNADFTFVGTQNLDLGTGGVTMSADRQVTVTAKTLTVGGVIGGGAVGLTKAGTGTLVLAGANTYSGATALSAGTLRLADANAVAASSGLTMANGTTLQLRSNTAAAFNTPTYAVTPGTSVTFDVDNNGSGSNNQLTLNGQVQLLNATGTTTLNFTGANGYTLRIPSLTHYVPATGTLTLNATSSSVQIDNLRYARTSSGTTVLNLNGTSTGNSVNGFSKVTGGTYGDWLNVYKNDSGTWTWAAPYDSAMGLARLRVTAGNMIVTGTVYVPQLGGSPGVELNGGVLHYNSAGAVNASTATDTFKFGGGSLDNSSGTAITTSTYNPKMQWNADFIFLGSKGADSDLDLGTGAVAMSATRIVTIQNAATTLSVGGVITGAGFGLTKAGPGALALDGANAYTGPTTVNQGTLLVNGSLNAASAVTVKNTGTLGGTGTIGGAITVEAGGILAPGASAGTLKDNASVRLMGNSIYNWEFDSPTAADKVVITGSLQLDTGWKLSLGGAGTPAAGSEYDIFTYTTGFSGTIAGNIIFSPAGWPTAKIAQETGRIYLKFGQPGDTNNDGVVDAADYLAVKQNLGLTTGATLAQGNVDEDGDVDWDDLQIVMTNFGGGAGTTPATTPEPATLGLLAIGALAVLRRNRRS